MTLGLVIAIIGGACAVISCGIGSSIGVYYGGKTAAGVLGEKPELFGRLLLLQALPATQGIYGFLAAILLMVNLGMLGGEMKSLTASQGWAYFGAMMPITILGLASAIFQSKVVVASMQMSAENPKLAGRGVIISALIETYAILGLLVSILLLFGM